MDEVQRIKQVYAKRDVSGKKELYSFFRDDALFASQQREAALIDLLKQYGISDLTNASILDVGCGNGSTLRDFLKYGARPENLHGIDLVSDRLEMAQSLSPNIDFRCGDASTLPWEDEKFDLIMQYTVFTSILDKHMRYKVAAEMLRVLKKDGLIIWYDYYLNNPKNPDVKGVRKKEIINLFPNCRIFLRKITIAPPIARLMAPYSRLLCYLLEKLRILNTHYLGGIKKNKQASKD